jgi:tRNA(Ile)-lysidine synthase
MRRLTGSDPIITLVRPLLTVSRREIRDYLANLSQPYREDQSNSDITRTRARIRHDLLPKLASEYNPKVAEALVRLGSLNSAFLRAIEADVRKLVRASVFRREPDCTMLKQPYLNRMPAIIRAEVLRRVWRNEGWPEQGMSAKRWRRLAALVRKKEIPKEIEIGGHVAVSITNGFVVLRQLPAIATSVREEPIPLDTPGFVLVPWANCRIVANIDPTASKPDSELIDFDQVELPLHVRQPAPGDRFDPLGMNGSTMPLADFFRGRRVLADMRSQTPLVCDQRGIIWVVGHRIADRVKRTENTGRTLGLSFRFLD